MLSVSFLICSTGFASSYLNLTNIYIEIKSMQTDMYNKVFENNVENLTIKNNNCYEVTYYLDDDKSKTECEKYNSLVEKDVVEGVME